MREWWYSSTILDLGTRRWVVRFMHLPLYPRGKRPPVTVEEEAGWAPKPVYTLRRREISCPWRISKPGCPIRSPSLCRLNSLLIIFSQVMNTFPALERTQGFITAFIRVRHISSHAPAISGHMAPSKCISIHSNATWPSFYNENRLYALSSAPLWPP
jgi:hypothetical protein